MRFFMKCHCLMMIAIFPQVGSSRVSMLGDHCFFYKYKRLTMIAFFQKCQCLTMIIAFFLDVSMSDDRRDF